MADSNEEAEKNCRTLQIQPETKKQPETHYFSNKTCLKQTLLLCML